MKNLKLATAFTALLTLAACGGGSQISGHESHKYYGEQVEDTKIITQVMHSFRANNAIPHKNIHIAIDRGILQLSGFVRTNMEADLSILAAKNVTGVKDVINNIVVLSSNEYALRRANAEARDAQR